MKCLEAKHNGPESTRGNSPHLPWEQDEVNCLLFTCPCWASLLPNDRPQVHLLLEEAVGVRDNLAIRCQDRRRLPSCPDLAESVSSTSSFGEGFAHPILPCLPLGGSILFCCCSKAHGYSVIQGLQGHHVFHCSWVVTIVPAQVVGHFLNRRHHPQKCCSLCCWLLLLAAAAGCWLLAAAAGCCCR